ILISSGRNRHATPVCISKYLRNRPRAGGSTSQCARLVGVKIASSGAKHKPNPTGGREGSQISGVPKAGKKKKTQRFKKKGVLEGLHQEISGFYTGINQSKLTEPLPRAGFCLSQRSRCLLLAQSRHAPVHCTCPLSGVKQTWRESISISAKDPKRTL